MVTKQVLKLESDYLSKFTSIVQYGSDTTDMQPVAPFDFSLLTGKLLAKDKVFKMTDVQSKYIILDFWYTSCYPCIKSIPAINQIYENYKGKGVTVFGINPIDDAIKSKARLEKFLLNNPMGYETIMVDNKIGNQVCAEGYPTFIILDQDYKVLYKESGYRENLYQEISVFLDEALKNRD